MAQFRRLIMADWSAASVQGPARPAANRCWVGRIDPGEQTPEIAYCRTRALALDRIQAWVAEAGGQGSVLIGFDFPFGYPAGSGLPGGRALGAFYGERLQDDERDGNDRFALAARLNRELLPDGEGPFWGHPAGRHYPGLGRTRPKPWPASIPELRAAEECLRGTGIQTVWKLAYPASVGSQVMTGMAAIHRLLQRPGFADAAIWPFETDWQRQLAAITIAEIWPNMFYPARRAQAVVAAHPIRDAQQIAAALLALAEADREGRIAGMLAAPAGFGAAKLAAISGQEGWIVGA